SCTSSILLYLKYELAIGSNDTITSSVNTSDVCRSFVQTLLPKCLTYHLFPPGLNSPYLSVISPVDSSATSFGVLYSSHLPLAIPTRSKNLGIQNISNPT